MSAPSNRGIATPVLVAVVALSLIAALLVQRTEAEPAARGADEMALQSGQVGGQDWSTWAQQTDQGSCIWMEYGPRIGGEVSESKACGEQPSAATPVQFSMWVKSVDVPGIDMPGDPFTAVYGLGLTSVEELELTYDSGAVRQVPTTTVAGVGKAFTHFEQGFDPLVRIEAYDLSGAVIFDMDVPSLKDTIR